MASKGTLTLRILGDEKPLKKSMDKASGVLSGWAKGAVTIFAGLGVAAGAVLVKEFGDAMERGRMQDRLAAQLNLTEAEAEKAGKIAGDLYADAYGDSLEQVHDAVGSVMSSLEDLDDGDVEDLTAKALDLAAAFDVDVTESVSVAGVMMRNGMARDGQHAFDLITRAMQSVPAQMRGELIPIIEEYAQDFEALGIEGEDAFGVLVEAAGDGRIELDKTGDALKEFTIRSTDMSTTSVEAYEDLGLSAENMANDILEGGDTAREAFDTIIQGLLDIEDPSDRAQTAIALFGTPIEDLSVTEIPQFLQRLADMDGGLGDVEGAAEDMGNTLNDNVATKVESFKRRAGTAIEAWVYENVLPGAEQVIAAFEKDGVGGALDKAIELWQEAQPRIKAWWTGTFIPFWEDTAVPHMSHIGGAMAIGLVNALIQGLANALPRVIEFAVDSINDAIEDVFFLGDVLPDAKLPRVDIPNIPNPVSAPSSPLAPSYDSSGPGGRFHTGGLITSNLPRTAGAHPNERDIRVKVGEGVFTPGQMAAMGGGRGHTTVNINVNAGNVVGSTEELVRKIQRGLREYNRRAGTTAIA